MKKSKNISKYEVNWQIVRYLVKKEKTIESKLSIVRNFYLNNFTIDNKERCLNWLEGLALGYKKTNSNAIYEIQKEVMYFADTYPTKEENTIIIENELIKLNQYDVKTKIGLLKDLYQRNEKWLKNGYFHQEQNNFLDILYLDLKEEELGKYSYKQIKQLRDAALFVKCSHKFLF